MQEELCQVEEEGQGLRTEHARALQRLFSVEKELGKVKKEMEEWEGTREGRAARGLEERLQELDERLKRRCDEKASDLEEKVRVQREKLRMEEEVQARKARCRATRESADFLETPAYSLS